MSRRSPLRDDPEWQARLRAVRAAFAARRLSSLASIPSFNDIGASQNGLITQVGDDALLHFSGRVARNACERQLAVALDDLS